MDFGWAEHEQAFRREVCDFLDRYWGDDAGVLHIEVYASAAAERAREFDRRLAEHGWLTMAWPPEYGGRGASHIEQMIFAEEAARRGAPTGGQGPRFVGPMLIHHGSEAQRREHLPRIARSEVLWCEGFSEPGAGSDLASLTTRAVRDGDQFILNGQKIWTTDAQVADWIHVMARTDPDAPKHRGISYFIVSMATPGISVRPLLQMHGVSGFNETFFEDVRVPASNLVGTEGRGWYVAMTTLDFERSGVHRASAVERQLTPLVERGAAGWRGLSPAGRLAIVSSRIELEVGRLLGYRVGWLQSRGQVPNYETSVSKAFNTELLQRHAQRAMNLFGPFGGITAGPYAPFGGQYASMYMSTVAVTIAGGTSEIQRNIIATRGLGLPRG